MEIQRGFGVEMLALGLLLLNPGNAITESQKHQVGKDLQDHLVQPNDKKQCQQLSEAVRLEQEPRPRDKDPTPRCPREEKKHGQRCWAHTRLVEPAPIPNLFFLVLKAFIKAGGTSRAAERRERCRGELGEKLSGRGLFSPCSPAEHKPV